MFIYRYRISNASMFRYREETRAAKISALVIVTAAACWTPYAVLKLSEWPPLSGGGIPSPGPLAALLSLSAHAVITPILFAHRNRRVHRELCRIFCRRKRCSSFYDNVRNATVASSVATGPVKSGATVGGVNAGGPQHVFGRWFGGGPGGIRFGKSATQPSAVPSSVVVPTAAHLPTDTEMTRSSFSSNGSTTTQTSSVITVDWPRRFAANMPRRRWPVCTRNFFSSHPNPPAPRISAPPWCSSSLYFMYILNLYTVHSPAIIVPWVWTCLLLTPNLPPHQPESRFTTIAMVGRMYIVCTCS